MCVCLNPGGGPAGHPKVYINVDKPEVVTCNYCSLPYVRNMTPLLSPGLFVRQYLIATLSSRRIILTFDRCRSRHMSTIKRRSLRQEIHHSLSWSNFLVHNCLPNFEQSDQSSRFVVCNFSYVVSNDTKLCYFKLNS